LGENPTTFLKRINSRVYKITTIRNRPRDKTKSPPKTIATLLEVAHKIVHPEIAITTSSSLASYLCLLFFERES
jgi:hypothetical protein